jgi:bifunctional UDP-N-acetylglucosamine pyrophosphorylase/glucosamine-1-phosphate N-acetyltransferase
MTARSCLAVVLAAGEGTRMRSSKAKVLHEVAGRSLLAHVLTAVAKAGVARAAVVVGPGQAGHDQVAAEARCILPEAEIFTNKNGAAQRMPCWRQNPPWKNPPTTSLLSMATRR